MNKDVLKNILKDQIDAISKDKSLFKRDCDLDNHLASDVASVITGVRRCGKSSLLKQIVFKLPKDLPIFYLNFEDIRLNSFTVNDFQTALDAWRELQTHSVEKIYLLYDEIQNIEKWEKWIASLSSAKNIKVFLTGSNSEMLSSELSSHITGRHKVLHLTPFSFYELVLNTLPLLLNDKSWMYSSENTLKLRRLLNKYLKLGGFPKVYLNEENDLLSQYFKDIVVKDIIVRKNIRNQKELIELGSILMTEHTKLINKNNILDTLGISKGDTLNNYLSYFEDVYLVREIKKYNPSLKKQLRSQSKFYAIDATMASQVGFSFSKNIGAQLEAIVFQELNRKFEEIFYWHSQQNFEVDFIIKQGMRITQAIQVCSNITSTKILEREVRSLKIAKEKLAVENLILIYFDKPEQHILELIPSQIKTYSFEEWAISTSMK